MQTADVPDVHAAFLARAMPRLQAEPRFVGVAAAGSYAGGSMDEFSDLDLIIAVEPAFIAAVTDERQRIAAALGPLVAAFTGEHVKAACADLPVWRSRRQRAAARRFEIRFTT